MKNILKILLLFLFIIPCNSFTRYEVTCNKQLLQASQDSLYAQIGYIEKTNKNDGKQIEKYLKSVNLTKGNPYCAAGQYWCFSSACHDLGLSSSVIPIYKTGSTVKMFNIVKKKGLKSNIKVRKNDLIFWVLPNGINGHVERIIKVKKAGWIETIGFNTSSGIIGDQRNGGGVYKRNRNLYHILGRMKVRGLIGFKNK
jgi:hypothetical protein